MRGVLAIVDANRRDRHATRHLHDREQRVDATKRPVARALHALFQGQNPIIFHGF